MPANVTAFGHRGVEKAAERSLLFAWMGKMAHLTISGRLACWRPWQARTEPALQNDVQGSWVGDKGRHLKITA